MSAVFDARSHREYSDSRKFNYAMAASLVLHMALLFSFSMRPATNPPASPGPIVARLAPPPAPAAVPAPAQAEPAKPKVEEAAPTPPPQVKAVPLPKPSPMAKPAPAQKPSAPAPTAAAPAPAPTPPSPPQPAPSAAAPPSAVSAAPPVAKADPAPSAPATAPPADAGTLETYRLDLLRMARQYKRYPRVAMDNNWEGRVVVRMVIGANGMISAISIVTSAGHEILDKQAIDMLQKAKPRVQIPTALRGKEFAVEVPVIYSLKEPDSG